MSYPQSLGSIIVIPKNIVDRDIADTNGFDVIFENPTLITMARRRPDHIKFLGHVEFLASLPPERIEQAEASISGDVVLQTSLV